MRAQSYAALVGALLALPIIALAATAKEHDEYLVELDARQHRAAGDVARLEAAVDELAAARAAHADQVGVRLERTEMLRYVIRPLYNRLGAGEPPSLLAPWPEVP